MCHNVYFHYTAWHTAHDNKFRYNFVNYSKTHEQNTDRFFFSLVNYYQLHLKCKMTFEVYSLMFKFIDFAKNMSHKVQWRNRYMHTKGYRKA